jgi:putative transposase
MKKSKYTEEQIVGILKEVEAGIAISEICRKYGISDATYYNWKAKYGGMTVSDVKKLRQLEDENRRLKHIVADLTLDNQALKAVIAKNF